MHNAWSNLIDLYVNIDTLINAAVVVVVIVLLIAGKATGAFKERGDY